MSQPPAFQFYASDFRADANVSAMTLEEVGAYTLLLTFCWTEGCIPTDRRALTRLLKIDHRTLDRIWPALAPCFTVKGDSYVQGRMERERAKQAQFREHAAASGRRGAGKRWGWRRGGDGDPIPTLSTGDDKPTETPSETLTGLDSSPSPISDLPKNPPTPRKRGATRAERKRAQEIRRLNFGRCQHEPKCETADACVDAIVASLRAVAS